MGHEFNSHSAFQMVDSSGGRAIKAKKYNPVKDTFSKLKKILLEIELTLVGSNVKRFDSFMCPVKMSYSNLNKSACKSEKTDICYNKKYKSSC